jgi:phospholipase D1/2
VNAAFLVRHPLARIALAAIVATAVLAGIWHFTPLRDFVTAERVLPWVEDFSGYWWAPIALALSYTPASLVMFPRPLLTLAAVVAFGPWEGLAVALAGIAVNTLALYAAGRMMARDTLERLGGKRYARVGKLLRKEGFVAVMTVGLLPVAPFALLALAFGALRMKLYHVVPGVLLAMLPGMIATVLLGDQLAAAISHERSLNLWIVVAVVAAMVVLGWFTRNWWKKLQAAVA